MFFLALDFLLGKIFYMLLPFVKKKEGEYRQKGKREFSPYKNFIFLNRIKLTITTTILKATIIQKPQGEWIRGIWSKFIP